MRGADIVVTVDAAREPILRRAWLADGTHVNAVGRERADDARAGRGDDRPLALFVDRRESAVERGGRLPARAQGGRGRSRAHPGRARRACSLGIAPGPPLAAEITVFKSLGLAIEDLAAARARVRARARARRGRAGRGRRLRDPRSPRSAQARETHRGHRGAHTARPARRADGPAEIYLKLETLQPIGSFKIRGAGNAAARPRRDALAARRSSPRAPATWRRVSRGAPRALGVPATVVAPDTAPRGEARARSSGSAGGRARCRSTTGGDVRWRRTVRRASTGLFIHPVDDADVMAGNGTIGLELLEDLPDVDAVVVPWGGGGLHRDRGAGQAAQPGARVSRREPETARRSRPRSLASRRAGRVDYRPTLSTASGSQGVLAGHVAARCRRSSTGALVVDARRGRRRACGCWRSACA